MFKKIIFIFLFILMFSGCSNNELESNNENAIKYEQLVIKTQITNEESKDDSYMVYLMPVGLLNREAGYANQSGYYGPFETDSNGEVIIDMEYNYDLAYYLDSDDNEKENSLEVLITTKEDKYIRNPLNGYTEVEFIKNDTDEEYPSISYYSSIEELVIPFTDKYPDGVLSLTFQDADFVIKFEFEEGYKPTNSYETFIFWNDPSMPDGIGIVNVGRINREFQYWDTPFYKEDNLASKTGTIIVRDFNTNQRINYVEYPKTVSFDKDGNCIEGDILRITIPKPE